jgi:hypothetical protein
MTTKEIHDECSLPSTFDGIGVAKTYDSSQSKGGENGFGVAKESASVNVLKRYIIGLFALGTLIGSTTTWRFTSSQEHHAFSESYHDHASWSLEAFHGKMKNRIAEAAELSATLTSFMKKHPRTAEASPDSKGSSCAVPLYMAHSSWLSLASTGELFSPMVYATAQDDESIRCNSSHRKDGKLNYEHLHNEENFTNNDSNAAAKGRILVDGIWCNNVVGRVVGDESGGQSRHTPPDVNVMSFPSHGQWVICDISDDDICQRTMEVMKRIGAVLLSDIQVKARHQSSPTSYFFAPVIQNPAPDKAVPSMTVKIDWQSLLRDSIPLRGRHGKVTIVVGNSCGQVHSFESNGDNEVQYLGEGDLHDVKFNHLGRSSDKSHLHHLHDSLPSVNAYRRDHNVDHESVVHGRQFDPHGRQPLNFTTKCEYKVSIYPTTNFKRKFITAKPIFYTFLVLLLSALTIKTFLEYDSIVMKRQANVMRKAVAAETIVNSLFPHNVRDRVFQNAKQPPASTQKTSRSVDQHNSKNQRLKRIMLAGIAPKTRNRKAGQPIADLFPNTTVVRMRYCYGFSLNASS